MSYEKNSWKKTDDEVIRDYDDYAKLNIRQDIENELGNRGYEYHEREWIHKDDIEEDDGGGDVNGGLIGFGILAAIGCVIAIFISPYIHYVLQFPYHYRNYAFYSFGILLILLFLSKGNDGFKALFGLTTFSAVFASYPVLITQIEKVDYIVYLKTTTDAFSLIGFACGFVIYLPIVTWLIYKIVVFCVNVVFDPFGLKKK